MRPTTWRTSTHLIVGVGVLAIVNVTSAPGLYPVAVPDTGYDRLLMSGSSACAGRLPTTASVIADVA